VDEKSAPHGWGRSIRTNAEKGDSGTALTVGWWRHGKENGNVQKFQGKDLHTFLISGWYENGVFI